MEKDLKLVGRDCTFLNHFFAYLFRMRLIKRWGLMHNISEENAQEHSLQVAIIAHALAIIKKEIFEEEINPEHIMGLAVYHEAAEVITGDLATPIKYYNPDIKKAYQAIEQVATKRLLGMLPEEIQSNYLPYLQGNKENSIEWKLVKAADKISAYLKCLEERKMGNMEFLKAEKTIKDEIHSLNLKEVQYFMEKFVPSFNLTLDELN